MTTSILYWADVGHCSYTGCYRKVDSVSPEGDGSNVYTQWFAEQGCVFRNEWNSTWMDFENEADAIIFKLRHGI